MGVHAGPDRRRLGGRGRLTQIGGGAETSEAVAMWTVDDIEAAVERVVTAGVR